MMSLLPFPARSGAALVAVGDPSRDRTVYATIVLLVALGLTMILLAVWLMRSTRPDPEVLAPLERMGQRKWRRADPVWQRRHLDDVRPGGADPLEPMSAPPSTDAEFERGPQPIGFDDLVVASPTAIAVGSDLPAPPPGAVAVDGPVDDARGDVSAIDTAGASRAADAVADDSVDSAIAAVGSGGDESGEEGSHDGDTSAVGAEADEDDEDITGEQDTDDFLAVLDDLNELDPAVVPVEVVEPAVESAGGSSEEGAGEPEVVADGSEIEPEAEPVSGSEVEPVADPVSDPDAGEHDEPG